MAGTIDHVTGEQMYKLAERLFPICRSITGEGVRQTLQILQEDIPLEIREIPTGTPVFDWTIPREWNVKDAWVKDPSGQKIIDFKKNAKFVKISASGLRESHPHDVIITKESPNYHS